VNVGLGGVGLADQGAQPGVAEVFELAELAEAGDYMSLGASALS
jgi:hypothetical protein